MKFCFILYLDTVCIVIPFGFSNTLAPREVFTAFLIKMGF